MLSGTRYSATVELVPIIIDLLPAKVLYDRYRFLEVCTYLNVGTEFYLILKWLEGVAVGFPESYNFTPFDTSEFRKQYPLFRLVFFRVL